VSLREKGTSQHSSRAEHLAPRLSRLTVETNRVNLRGNITVKNCHLIAMPTKTTTGFEHLKLRIGQSSWRSRALKDTRFTDRRSVLERREHCAAKAFVKGRRWFANQLLEFQLFPNRRFACKALLQNSRRLIEESHHVILKSKNTLAFSRGRRLAN
jgi:hypothetical protein